MSKDARPPWLDEALAGIYVLRNVDQLAADGIVRALPGRDCATVQNSE